VFYATNIAYFLHNYHINTIIFYLKCRDKDAVLSGLEQTLPYLRGKDLADVLMKIADLQQMKKDENTEEEETVHYYLPLQCYRCSLFIADRAKRKAEEAEKPDYI